MLVSSECSFTLARTSWSQIWHPSHRQRYGVRLCFMPGCCDRSLLMTSERRACQAFHINGKIITLHLARCDRPIKRRCHHGKGIKHLNPPNLRPGHLRRNLRPRTRNPILPRSLQTNPRRQRDRDLPLCTSSREDHAREPHARKHGSHRVHERDRGEQRRRDRCLQFQQSRRSSDGS